jgi:hypothetical protein
LFRKKIDQLTPSHFIDRTTLGSAETSVDKIMAEQHSGRESRLAYSLHQFLWNSPDYLVSIAHIQRVDHRAKHRQSEGKELVCSRRWRFLSF